MSELLTVGWIIFALIALSFCGCFIYVITRKPASTKYVAKVAPEKPEPVKELDDEAEAERLSKDAESMAIRAKSLQQRAAKAKARAGKAAEAVMEAARKTHNCRYFSNEHLGVVCSALGDQQVRGRTYGWFCNDVEKWARAVDP